MKYLRGFNEGKKYSSKELEEFLYDPKLKKVAKIFFDLGKISCTMKEAKDFEFNFKQWQGYSDYHATLDPFQMPDEKSSKKAVKESIEVVNLYGYPSLEEVEAADHESICRWYRHLPSPGSKIPDSLPNDKFKEAIDKQAAVMNLICDKYKEGGGFNSSLSKKIGF